MKCLRRTFSTCFNVFSGSLAAGVCSIFLDQFASGPLGGGVGGSFLLLCEDEPVTPRGFGKRGASGFSLFYVFSHSGSCVELGSSSLVCQIF